MACAHCEYNLYGTEHLIILPLILHTVIIVPMLLLKGIGLCELYYYQASVFLIRCQVQAAYVYVWIIFVDNSGADPADRLPK